MNDYDCVNFKDEIICSECSNAFRIDDSCFESFFKSEEITCPNCNKVLNLWKTINGMLEIELVSFGWHYSLLGCVNSEFEILLKHNENTLDLSTIVGDGELVYINYSWAGHPHYILTQEPLVRINKNKIMLFPGIMTENQKEVEIGVYLWFAPKEMLDDLSTMLLLDAFQKYYDKNYRYMLISAQTSVEVLQYKFLNKLLKENKISTERIEDFLENKVPFSTQLFTLLPFLANIMDFPIWKKGSQIEEGLRILRDNRNDAVHRGKLERQLNNDKLQKALLGAFFALKYFKIIHKIS